MLIDRNYKKKTYVNKKTPLKTEKKLTLQACRRRAKQPVCANSTKRKNK
ncbi:MAG: hypothetical protein [Arizlama microvirus]|nr:MAG: hypothetical protein [Arizlama microvirus]